MVMFVLVHAGQFVVQVYRDGCVWTCLDVYMLGHL
jgi:hypothetical protein